jgi:hypothetical protein
MEFRSWSEGASFPLLPSADSARVFIKLRQHPRLDAAPPRRIEFGGRGRRPSSTTADKHLFELDR